MAAIWTVWRNTGDWRLTVGSWRALKVNELTFLKVTWMGHFLQLKSANNNLRIIIFLGETKTNIV